MRFTKQVVIDTVFGGEVYRNRNVRKASARLVESLGAPSDSFTKRCTIGVARISGMEVPVVRTANRRWAVLAEGILYSA